MKFIIILILAVGAITVWFYLQVNKNNKKQTPFKKVFAKVIKLLCLKL